MKLSEWASVAEIISAVAIVVSLIFVGLEIRRNTEAEYLSSYDRLLADTADWRMDLATNRETVEAFNAFQDATDMASLDRTVRAMGNHAAIAVTQIWERAYFARVYGRLGNAEWSRYQAAMCDPDNDEIHTKLRSDRFSQEFWDYLSHCIPE